MSTPQFAAYLAIELVAIGLIAIVLVGAALHAYDWWTERRR